MNPLFRDKKIFLIGGPGGVGKTTLAASLAIQLAAEYRTVVLTVDPARRLAQALGLEGFAQDLQEVKLPPGARGTLHASMLDTQRYFDKIIDRFARNPQQKEKILRNPLYRTTIDSLGGTHEYAAMERLLEFAGDTRFEKVVIDTPPSQNAVDLLSAPQRMADFMDNSVLKWFQGTGPAFLRLFQTGTRFAMKVLQRLFGGEFLSTFGEFLADLEGMQAGFRERNLQVIELLRSPDTAFWLVTYPSEPRFRESLAFIKTLGENRIQLAALALNRLEVDCPAALDLAAPVDPAAREKINTLLKYYHGLFVNQKTWVDRFAESLPQLPRYLIPQQPGEIHDVQTLLHLAEYLAAPA